MTSEERYPNCTKHKLELELNREAMNRKWLLCVDSSWSSFEAFRICCEKMINSPYDHLFLLSLYEKPSKFLHTDDSYNTIVLQHEDLCKKVLSFYGHRAEALGIFFTMLGSGCSHVGKKICEIIKQFNIGTIVLGQSSKIGSGSVCSYLVENCEASVFIIKGAPDLHLTPKKLSLLIQNEKLVDMGQISSKTDSVIPQTQPDIMEFFFYDIDSIAAEYKIEHKEMSKLLEKELNKDQNLTSESKKKEAKTSWPRKSSIGGSKRSAFSQLDKMLTRPAEVQLIVKDSETTETIATEDKAVRSREESVSLKKRVSVNKDKGKKQGSGSISEATV